jgi:hypothetical protein
VALPGTRTRISRFDSPLATSTDFRMKQKRTRFLYLLPAPG